MNIEEYMKVLRARWVTVWLTFGIVFALSIILSFVIPDHYKGIATVVPNLKASNPMDTTAVPASMTTSYEGTQIDIIQSDTVARKVVQKLQLNKRQEALDAWHESYFYRPDNFEAWAVWWLDKKLKVEPPKDSSVLEIKFSSRDPQFAVDGANAYADAYVEASLALNVEPAKDAAKWFSDLTVPLRSQLEEAQNRLSTFQQQHNIVATDDRIDVETTQLNELQQQLVTAQGQRADSSSRQSHSVFAVEALPEVLQNPVISALKAEMAKDEATLKDMAFRLGTNHPQYISMESQLASLQEHEADEMQRVVGSISSNNRVSVGREAALMSAIASQKARVLQLRVNHDQAAMLQKDVDAAQSAYTLVTQRLAQSTLESQLKQTNVVILSRAQLPFRRSWPVLWLDALGGLFVGGLLGVGLALLREFLDSRVHSLEQLGELANVPAFGMGIATSRAANQGGTVWSRAKGLLTHETQPLGISS